MANNKKVSCPACQTSMNKGTDPHTCKNPLCGLLFNTPVLSVSMRVVGLPEVVTKQTFDAFHDIGEWFMIGFEHLIHDLKFTEPVQGQCPRCAKDQKLVYEQAGRLLCDACGKKATRSKDVETLTPIETRVGQCERCVGEKTLQYELDGELICAPCGNYFLFHDHSAKAMLMPIAQKRFPYVPRQTIFERAYTMAHSSAKTWFEKDENWVALVLQARSAAYIKACKERALALPYDATEPREIAHIRRSWAESRAPICLVRHCDFHFRAMDIKNVHHRRQDRRDRLRELNKRFRTPHGKKMHAEQYAPEHGRKRPKWKTNLHDVVFKIVGPVCGEGKCEHLKYYSWGWECDLQAKRPDNFPKFPRSVVSLYKGSYWMPLETGKDDHLDMALWTQRVKQTGEIRGTEWLAESYDYTQLDNNPYATLLRRHRQHRDPEEGYYFIRPTTYTVPVVPGDWTHYVLNGPRETIVLSVLGEQESVDYHHHARVARMKAYYAKQRAAAQAGVVLPGVLDDADGVRYTAHDAKDAATYLKKTGALNVVGKIPETSAGFGEWFRDQDEGTTALIAERAKEQARIKLLRDALRSLCRDGSIAADLRLPTNREFLAWYGRTDGAFREMVGARVQALQQRRAVVNTAPAVAVSKKQNQADGEEGDEDGRNGDTAEERRKGWSGYFKHPRNKEWRVVNMELHEETREVVERIFDRPGHVVLVCTIRQSYGRSEDERKILNDRLHCWPEGIFRQLFSYKALLAGFNFRECENDLSALALCPHCGAEIAGTWQAWLIEHEADSARCPSCEQEFNLLYAIVSAMRKLPEQKRRTRKERKKKGKVVAENTTAEALSEA